MNGCPDCQVLVLTNQNHNWENITDRRRHMNLIKCTVCGQESEADQPEIILDPRPIAT